MTHHQQKRDKTNNKQICNSNKKFCAEKSKGSESFSEGYTAPKQTFR